jgi:DNA-binding transcriptional ArsR family regulator
LIPRHGDLIHAAISAIMKIAVAPCRAPGLAYFHGTRRSGCTAGSLGQPDTPEGLSGVGARGRRRSAVGRLQARIGIAASTLSHHLHKLITVGLVSQERQATTLICRANYPVMHGLLGFLAEECCVEGCPPQDLPDEAA